MDSCNSNRDIGENELKMAATSILNVLSLQNFVTAYFGQRYTKTKCHVCTSIGGLVVAFCVKFKVAAAAISIFVGSKLWRCDTWMKPFVVPNSILYIYVQQRLSYGQGMKMERKMLTVCL